MGLLLARRVMAERRTIERQELAYDEAMREIGYCSSSELYYWADRDQRQVYLARSSALLATAIATADALRRKTLPDTPGIVRRNFRTGRLVGSRNYGQR
jgi:hypothetical protein